MSDLTEFVLARIAEDEAAARDALEDGRGTPEPEPWLAVGWPRSEHPGPVVFVGPERFLAECEAKRRTVNRHRPEEFMDAPGEFFCLRCQPSGNRGMWPCPDLRDLASVYAEHPDYREEWKP